MCLVTSYDNKYMCIKKKIEKKKEKNTYYTHTLFSVTSTCKETKTQTLLRCMYESTMNVDVLKRC